MRQEELTGGQKPGAGRSRPPQLTWVTAWGPAKCQAAQAHTDKHSPREAQGEQHRGGRDAQRRRHFRGLRRQLELDVIWAGPRTAGRIWRPGAAWRITAGGRVPFTKGESGEAGGARPG